MVFGAKQNPIYGIGLWTKKSIFFILHSPFSILHSLDNDDFALTCHQWAIGNRQQLTGNRTMVSTSIQITVNNVPDTKVVLRLLLRNQTQETLLLRPTIDDWVIDDNQVISLISKPYPPFVALHPQGEVTQTISIQLPSDLHHQQTLKSWLRFPGLHEQAIPIQVEVVSPEEVQAQSQVVDLQLTFPLESNVDHSSDASYDPTTEGIFWLMPILMDLDKIPSRWLVAELLVKLYQQGAEYRKTTSGYQLLNELKSTSFWENGVFAFSSAQLPKWIAETIFIERQILGAAKPIEGHLLYIWENWLWSLVDKDIEVNEKTQAQTTPPFLPEDFMSELGLDTELWFANLLLGLAQISSTITLTLNKIISETSLLNEQSNQGTEASYSLTAGLPSLDTLTVRWLVVELFVILAQKGEKYATTKAGSELLNQLSRTRFFKNGVLTLASTKVPRWLHISQTAASAYHASLWYAHTQGGLIYTGEQWLRSLIPANIELDNSEHPASNNVMEAFVKKLGMDSDRWFGYGILGLAQVSPRIAATLQEIANKAPKQPIKKPSPQFKIEDILGEGNSLQR